MTMHAGHGPQPRYVLRSFAPAYVRSHGRNSLSNVPDAACTDPELEVAAAWSWSLGASSRVHVAEARICHIWQSLPTERQKRRLSCRYMAGQKTEARMLTIIGTSAWATAGNPYQESAVSKQHRPAMPGKGQHGLMARSQLQFRCSHLGKG